MSKTALLDGFDQAMIDIYAEAKRRCPQHAKAFWRMLDEYGSVRTAKMILAKARISTGFAELWIHGGIGVAVESLVGQSPWCSLFSAEELAIADSRLQSVAPPAA